MLPMTLIQKLDIDPEDIEDCRRLGKVRKDDESSSKKPRQQKSDLTAHA